MSARPSAAPKWASWPALRALKYPDFRWLWVGAFVSFTGSTMQGVAQQKIVLDITGSPARLAMVTFAMMLPVSLFGPFLGVVADTCDKRRLLVACMLVSAVGPLVLALVGWRGTWEYWMFLVVALVAGFVQCVEVPTRQSIVRAVVSAEDLSAAIPMQAMTFNLARVAGPAVAAPLLLFAGPTACFLFNGVSFFALVFAALAIRTDLRPVSQRAEPVRDLVFEGFRYTFRDRSLRTLFLMESATAVLGSFYISQLEVINRHQLGLGTVGLARCFASVGIGAFCGLLVTGGLSQKRCKPQIVLSAMGAMGASVCALGFVGTPTLAYLLIGCLGAFSIMQFNTTNTLFQLMSPPKLRGRVISMHMWAIAGVAPLGVLLFGAISERFGVAWSLKIGGLLLLVCFAWAWTQRSHVREPAPTE